MAVAEGLGSGQASCLLSDRRQTQSSEKRSGISILD